MQEIANELLKELARMWMADIRFVEARMWMIYTILPAVVYLAFFMVKWAAITAPLWIPFRLALLTFERSTKSKNKQQHDGE